MDQCAGGTTPHQYSFRTLANRWGRDLILRIDSPSRCRKVLTDQRLGEQPRRLSWLMPETRRASSIRCSASLGCHANQSLRSANKRVTVAQLRIVFTASLGEAV